MSISLPNFTRGDSRSSRSLQFTRMSLIDNYISYAYAIDYRSRVLVMYNAIHIPKSAINNLHVSFIRVYIQIIGML